MHSLTEPLPQNAALRPPTPKARVVAFHLLLSLAVIGLASVLVFGFWYPAELRELAGGLRLFAILAGVDAVCGPLLTMVLYRTTKSRREITLDLTLVALVQLAALAYGLHTLAQARPLVQVFETDRFRLISYADIAENDSQHLPPWFQPWGLAPVRTLGLRPVASASERLESLNSALQGVDAGQRPQRWQDYALNRGDVLQRAQPLATLQKAHAQQRNLVDEAVAKALRDAQPGETDKAQDLLWLPLVSRSHLDWVVLLDPASLRIRAYAPLDGFQ